MTETDAQKDRILVAVEKKTGHARILGRGSFKISASLKEFGGTLLDRGISRLVIDLRDCVGMDSTFMGVTAGLCGRFHRESGGKVIMSHASEKIQRLMSTLGLDRLTDPAELENEPVSEASLKELEIAPQTPLESAETMLEAHETLVAAHPENSPRFQDVLDYLREDIRRQRQG
jgi:anti-anti-sigma regulatory factor